MQLLSAVKGVTAPPNGNTIFSGVSLRSRRRRTKPEDDSSSNSGRGLSIGFHRSSSTSGDSSSALDTPPAPVDIRPRAATRAVPAFHPPVYNSHQYDVAVHGSMPLDTVSKSSPPHVAVRYGDTIRLFARSKYAGSEDTGGYVGTFEGSKRFLASKNPQKQDELACIPPIAACGVKQFKPSVFTILSNCGLGVGTPVSYGDVVVLVDADGRVWNNKMGVGPSTKNGCFGPKESNTPGEMYLSFYQLQPDTNGDDSSSESSDEEENFLFFSNLAKTTKTMAETTFGKPTQVELHLATAALRTMGKVMYYGDRNMIIDVADSNRVRSKFNRVITHFSKQQEAAPVQGGFLRCDGRGKTILFEMHGHEFPTIKSIDIKDVKKSEPSSSTDIDDRSTDEAGHHSSNARVLVSTVTDVEVGSPLLLRDVQRSMTLTLRFSDGGRVRVPCQRFLKHEGRTFARVVLNGKRPMRILVRATRALGRKKVDIRGTFRGTYRQIFKLSCGIVLAYLAAASVFTHVFGSVVVLPAVYVGVGAAVVVFLVEVFFPGKVVTVRQIKPVEAEHTRHILGNWNFTIVALEASESERLETTGTLKKATSIKVPSAYLVAENGDAAKALDRYEATLAWRKEVRADSILAMPQTHYDTIKANYTQFLHKHDKLGHPLYIEKIGSINIPQLKKLGVSQDTLFNHYLFAMEFTLKYAAHQLCPCDACASSETQKMCIVLDARGIGMRDMGGEAFEFIRRCTGVMQRHYPQRSFKIFIVNVPSWFGMAWKGVKPLLNEATRAKTNILTESETASALLEFIEADNLPVEYGGTCACPGGCETNSTYQLLQQALVKSVLECKPLESEEFVQQIERERSGESRSSSEGELSTETARTSSPPPAMGPIKREASATAVLDQLFRIGSSGADDGFTLDGVDDEGFCRSIPSGFFSEEVLKAGYLLKRSLRHKQFNPIWHRQLFILHPQFVRFAKTLDSEVYQIVSLTHDTLVHKTPKQNNSFEIVTPLMAANGHSLLLYAPTAYVLNNWVDAISAAIDQLKLKIPSVATPERSPIVSPRPKEASPEGDNQPTGAETTK
ncbi:hypothetical protein DVH05_028287 [Phytophthora capsici]|nr:hypothetical protein DVH05_028287 [Phytophthora capsici]